MMCHPFRRNSLTPAHILLYKPVSIFFLCTIVLNSLPVQGMHSSHLEQEITALRKKISQLPGLQPTRMPDGVRPCWITYQLKGGTKSLWIQFDFGKPVTPDSIALVPDYTTSGTPDGFPRHFKITLSNTNGDAKGPALCDYKNSTFEFDPKTIPHFFNSEKKSGRYLTITLYPPTLEPAGKPVFRFSEILIFNKKTNLALNASITSSLKKIQGDHYGLDNLNDGWTPLSIPEDPTTTSNCEGYHSDHNGGTTDPQLPYWVQIDLEKIIHVDQINFIPVIPKNFIGPDGYHFPRRFILEGSSSPDFTKKTTLLDSLESNFPNLGNHIFSLGCKTTPLRYLRLTVTKLERGLWNACFYSIAEIQVISRGINVAKNRPVKAYRSLDDLYLKNIREDLANRSKSAKTNLSDEEINREAEKIWHQKFKLGTLHWAKPGLVDGYSSHHELLPLPDWLVMIKKRASLQARVAYLETLKQNLIEQEQNRAKQLIYYSIAACVLIIALAIFWHNRRRKQIELQLRLQLAQDLHDDLGSDLCNISLVSQLLEKQSSGNDIALTNRIKTIRQSASRSLDSIRNIILLTQDVQFPMKELSVRLNHIAQNLLKPVDINCHFRFSSACKKNLSLTRKPTREIILAFKEILTNICKHSKADYVQISLYSSETKLTITVSDNGIGIPDISPDDHQLGISSIRKRMESLQGKLFIQSSPGTGSKLTMHIPLKQCSSRNNTRAKH